MYQDIIIRGKSWAKRQGNRIVNEEWKQKYKSASSSGIYEMLLTKKYEEFCILSLIVFLFGRERKDCIVYFFCEFDLWTWTEIGISYELIYLEILCDVSDFFLFGKYRFPLGRVDCFHIFSFFGWFEVICNFEAFDSCGIVPYTTHCDMGHVGRPCVLYSQFNHTQCAFVKDFLLSCLAFTLF